MAQGRSGDRPVLRSGRPATRGLRLRHRSGGARGGGRPQSGSGTGGDQHAFYAEGRDVTKGAVLARLAAEYGLDAEAFLAAWASEAAQQETWRDYAIAQRAGVTGFPTLVAGPNEEGVFGVVTRGYAPAAQVVAVLRDTIRRIAA